MGSLNELSKYRFNQALEDLATSVEMYESGRFKPSLNRSYYSIFHAIRSITALDGFDSSKHSGIIAYFNLHYVKSEIFDKSTSKLIKNASLLREQSDYQDFYTASKSEAKQQILDATIFIEKVKTYLRTKDVF